MRALAHPPSTGGEMPDQSVSRDDLAEQYVAQLPYEPYPVQEEALLNWFTSDAGVMVCAPTGTGKTLIAEAAVFEALHTQSHMYYTTPLIALTEQKFQELSESAVRWGFSADDVGLVTGNRRVNPDARVLVVVAEILFNRLLHSDTFDFAPVAAVVMDEFHSFNDPERGIVWELSLGMLPKHVRLLLLSATVGNSLEFVRWMDRAFERRVELVQSDQRKVPLTFQWLPDMLLNEQIEAMAAGDADQRKTPALIFCFNRDACWNVAEQLKGKNLISKQQQATLVDELKQYDWSQGAGPKVRQLLMRGVGVHHAGVLPRYRRIVERLFQEKLLSVTVCTETLAAGINLPARSIVVPTLLKGPPDKKKLLDPSAAHQMFGRAGRPQFDSQGYVFGLAHEDDVKILRWRQKYDTIPEDTKDPQLRKAKKALKKKMPKRRTTQQYWTELQFEQLRDAAPRKLSSRGPLPWRLLAHMLSASPEVEGIRRLVGKRLMDGKQLDAGRRLLTKMLMTLWRAGYVRLEPEPIVNEDQQSELIPSKSETAGDDEPYEYAPELARPTEQMEKLLLLRGINPLYGVFLVNQLGIANREERIQALESVLDIPGSVARYVRVPRQDELPPGPLATERLDVHLLQLGLVIPEQLGISSNEDEEPETHYDDGERIFVLTLADKLRIWFDYDFPDVHDVRTTSVWVAGEVLAYGGDFNKFITSKRLQKQEGVLFRHLLRLILLVGEMSQLTPADSDPDEWREDLRDIADRLTECCRQVDPGSTERMLESPGR